MTHPPATSNSDGALDAREPLVVAGVQDRACHAFWYCPGDVQQRLRLNSHALHMRTARGANPCGLYPHETVT